MKTSRKEKLIKLQEYMNLETGEIYPDSFMGEYTLYEKSILKKSLDREIARCDKCPNMNIPRLSANAPGWGNLNSPYFLVGQSLHEPGMVSGLPFILNTGEMIDCVLHILELDRYDVFISNAVHCHPPNNRPSTDEERRNCLSYLAGEIEIVKPRLLVCLGADAKWAIEKLGLKTNKECKVLKVKHPASFAYSSSEGKVDWIIKLANEMEKFK